MVYELMEHALYSVDWHEIINAITDTLFMLGISVLCSSIIGIPVGFILYATSKGRLLSNRAVYGTLSLITNILRSIPFIILLIVMMPFTTFLVGTSLGALGVIPPLVVGAFPFFARLIENALQEVDDGVVDMARSYGATNWQIVWHVLLPEILPSIIGIITVTAIALVSYTAMAGAVGGGGLGDLAIRYGYQRFQTNIMVITVVLLVVLVQTIQLIGDRVVFFLRK